MSSDVNARIRVAGALAISMTTRGTDGAGAAGGPAHCVTGPVAGILTGEADVSCASVEV
jgi:hypothetical protein